MWTSRSCRPRKTGVSEVARRYRRLKTKIFKQLREMRAGGQHPWRKINREGFYGNCAADPLRLESARVFQEGNELIKSQSGENGEKDNSEEGGQEVG